MLGVFHTFGCNERQERRARQPDPSPAPALEGGSAPAGPSNGHAVDCSCQPCIAARVKERLRRYGGGAPPEAST
jgi:hypothetical protein